MKQRVHVVLTLVLCLVLSCSGVLVGVPTAQAAGTGTWTAVNSGLTNTNVVSLAIDPITPTTLYAGTWGGGICRSTNSGTTWTAVNSGLSNQQVSSLAIDPITPTTLYAGTWGGGICRSTNSGTTWTAVNSGLTNQQVSSLAIDAVTPLTLYAGTWGGVFRSTDRGDHWTGVNSGLTNNNINCLAMDPLTPSTLYAGTWGGGVCRSTDGGYHWTGVNSGLANTQVSHLAINPVIPSTLYAASSQGGGVCRSTDSGMTWAAVNTGLTNQYVHSAAIDPVTPSTLYAGTVGGGVFRSTNGGAMWTTVGTGLSDDTDVRCLTIDPVTPTTLYAGTDVGGIFRYDAVVKPLTADCPKVSGPNPDWYLVENQPASVTTQKMGRTTLGLTIGNTQAKIDNSSYSLEAAPYIKDGRTMVPIRFISEGLGAVVSWNSTEKKVTIALEGKEIVLHIDQSEGLINGEKILLDASPEIKSGRTMVPVRLISEGLGADVSWNASSRTVSISKDLSGIRTIDGRSDADSDGLTFEAEKELGTNPNDKNSVYVSLADGRLKELKEQYPKLDIFSRMPDGRGEVSLPTKLSLGLDPTEAHNFDPILDDYNAIRYARTEGAETSKEGISDCIAQIVPKYGTDAGNLLKLVLLDGKSTEEDIAPAKEKGRRTLSELYEKQLRKPSGQTLEDFIASFSAEENMALILVSLGESTGMDAALAQLIAYSGDLNLARNNSGLCEIIRTFGAIEEKGKKISDYEIFAPLLAQPGERWKFAFSLYNELLYQKVDITKATAEEKKMFLSYVESRGALYESLADPRTAQGCTANQGFLAEITSRNFVAWQERVKMMTEAGVQVPELSFLDMGLITNPISVGYLENFRTGNGFSKPQKMSVEQINSTILEMYHDAADSSARNIIEFEKLYVGKGYPGYDNAKTDLFNPADIAITLDPTGFVEGKTEPYFGFFGVATVLNATEGRLSNIAASNDADHEFSEEKMVKNPGRTIFLGSQPAQASCNFSTLFKYMNWVNNVPVIEEYSLGEKKPTALALSGGSYKAIGQLKLEKLGLESNTGKHDYTGNYLYFNPYLLDKSDPFNLDKAGIVESHTKDDARTPVTSEYLARLPE